MPTKTKKTMRAGVPGRKSKRSPTAAKDIVPACAFCGKVHLCMESKVNGAAICIECLMDAIRALAYMAVSKQAA
jgi:hypothetical protein